jgi:glycosyltransferase involved in cell wall biosynthesis
MQFSQGSIVHIVNIDRPYEFLSAIRAARGHRIFVSPIHHQSSAVRRMRRAETGQGIRSFIGRVLPESGRELLAYAARSFKSDNRPSAGVGIRDAFFSLQASPSLWQRVGKALQEVEAVAVLALGESRDLQADTSWDRRNEVVIPNGLPKLPDARIENLGNEWSQREHGIVVAGRVEPRKRQLEIAREAIRTGVKVLFIGAASDNASSYAREFRALILSNDNVTWAGSVEHDKVLQIFQDTKVLLNVSWVEVQSLVDLEAASSGCFVVANSAGNSKEWLPNHVTSGALDSISEALSAADQLTRQESGPGLPSYSWTWEMCATELDILYGKLASRIRPA